MEAFTYKGISDGKYVEGDIEALNLDEASHLLKENKSSRRAILLSKQLFKPGELYSLVKLAFSYKRAAKKLNRISNLLAK